MQNIKEELNEKETTEEETNEEQLSTDMLEQCQEFVVSYSNYLFEKNNHDELKKLFSHIACYFHTIPENVKHDYETHIKQIEWQQEQLLKRYKS